MTPPPARRVRALSIHADYRCRNTGACCSSGWDIPLEPEVEEKLRAALREGRLEPAGDLSRLAKESCFRAVPGLPRGARVVLAADGAGRCVFLEADRRCAVQRRVGFEALASACRDFPRVVTLTPLGVSITLSHYCPTAAGMLFAAGPVDPSSRDPDRLRGMTSDGALRVVEDPPGFPASSTYEGLDARDALPPLLRPGVLMDWPSLERWERFAVSVLADEGRSPEAALDILAAAAEEARRWTPTEGPFAEFFARVLSSRVSTGGTAVDRSPDLSSRGAPFESGDEGSADGSAGGSLAPEPRSHVLGMTAAWRLVADCVPHRALLPSTSEGLAEAERRWVAPSWSSLARPIRRWLAAKAFASWLILQGGGLRVTVLGLRLALGVLRAEASRGCAEAGRALDGDLLKEAVRRADLLLVHLVDPEALARRLGRGESAGGPAAAW